MTKNLIYKYTIDNIESFIGTGKPLPENERAIVEALSIEYRARKYRTPKKPINGNCPRCKTTVNENDYDLNTPYVNYCPNCGQALDWSE